MKKLFSLLLFLPLLLAANEEAKQYFAEYQTLTIRTEKKTKLDAALALAPMNEYYRYEELIFYAGECYHQNWDIWIANAKKQLDRSQKFHADFPDYRSRDWNRMQIFNLHTIFGMIPFEKIYAHHNRPNSKQASEMAALCDQLRPLERWNKIKIWYPYAADRPPETLKELGNYKEIVYRSNMRKYFGNHEQFLRERQQQFTQLLATMESFVDKHPETKSQVNDMISAFTWLNDLGYSNGNILTDDAVVINYLMDDIEPLVVAMERSQFPYARAYSRYWRFLQMIAQTPRNQDSVEKAIDKWIELELKTPEKYAKSPYTLENICSMSDFFTVWYCRQPFVSERLKIVKNKMNKLTLPEIVDSLFLRNDWQALLANVPEMRRLNQQRISELKMDNLFHNNALIFGMNTPLSSEAWQFFEQMNADFEITPKSYAELLNCPTPLLSLGVLKRNNQVFMLFNESGRLSFGTWVLSESKGSLFRLSIDSGLFAGIDAMNLNFHNTAPWDCNGKVAAIALQNGALLIYDVNNQKEQIVPDILPASPRGVAIANERIYVLCGSDKNNKENYLISCDLKGKNYRIHFSNVRSDKQHDIERVIGKVNSLFALNDNELLFLISHNRANIYRYQIQQNCFELAGDLSGSAFHDRMYFQDGIIYTQSDGHGFLIQQFDPSLNRLKCIVMQNVKYPQIIKRDNPALCEHWRIQGPFVQQGDLFFSTNYTPVALNLKNPKQSPQLFMPNANFIIAKTQSNIIYFCAYRYFETKLKEAK